MNLKKITGGVSFISALGSAIWLSWIFFKEDLRDEELLIIILLLFLSITVIHFTITSKFYISKPDVIKSLELENYIIKKKIEKLELLAKLENLEKNG